MTDSNNTLTFNSSSPYETTITELLQLLENAKIISPENKQQAITVAQNYLAENSDFISVAWHIEDVLEVAAQQELQLTEDQCLEVLESLDSNHDANYGICWETISCTLQCLNFDSK